MSYSISLPAAGSAAAAALIPATSMSSAWQPGGKAWSSVAMLFEIA